ncbi:MAG TPA: hypothetical protein PK887_09250 [Ignavibacteriales bacterium]|nr:hypothetical protein [Ignavibacteriales bacterium]
MHSKFYYILLIFIIVTNYLNAQEQKKEYYKKIYENLEYRTDGFNDLKPQWYLNEPMLIRLIYNNLVLNGYLLHNGELITNEDTLKLFSNKFYNSRVLVKLRQRYYDNEIERMEMILENENPEIDTIRFIDPIRDWVLVREAVGDSLYEVLKKKNYSYTNITKDYFQSYNLYYYDLYFSMLNPSFMFWATTSEANTQFDSDSPFAKFNRADKYTMSFFGKWGADHIAKPGWYFSDYIVGLKILHLDMLVNDPDDYEYGLYIGFNFGVKDLLIENSSLFKPRRIDSKTDNLYIKASLNPFTLLGYDWRYFDFGIESYYHIKDKKVTDEDIKILEESGADYIYSHAIKNYFTIYARQKYLTNVLNLGYLYLGLGWTFHNYSLLTATIEDSEFQVFESVKYSVPYFEIGLTKSGGLIYNESILEFNYNTKAHFGFWGIKWHMMIRNNIGFDIKYYKGFGSVPGWHQDTYFVISPILRINF